MTAMLQNEANCLAALIFTGAIMTKLRNEERQRNQDVKIEHCPREALLRSRTSRAYRPQIKMSTPLTQFCVFLLLNKRTKKILLLKEKFPDTA